MNCRRALQTDYEEICRWWKAHGWACVPIEILPSGWVVEKDGKLLCAGFLYIAKNAPFSMMEWIVSNPANKLKENYAALDYLMGQIIMFSEYSGCLACYTKTNKKSLERILNKHGFSSECGNVKDMMLMHRGGQCL